MTDYTQLKLKPEYREKLVRLKKVMSRPSLANTAEALIDEAIVDLDNDKKRGGMPM